MDISEGAADSAQILKRGQGVLNELRQAEAALAAAIYTQCVIESQVRAINRQARKAYPELLDTLWQAENEVCRLDAMCDKIALRAGVALAGQDTWDGHTASDKPDIASPPQP